MIRTPCNDAQYYNIGAMNRLVNVKYQAIMRVLYFFLIVFVFYQVALGQDDTSQIKFVKKTFDDVATICNADDGNLWGKNLWGPIMVVDRETRFIIANQQDRDSILVEKDGVYCGYLPDNKIISNSTIDFSGTFWTIVAYMPEDEFERNTLFVHELFHRLQPEIGLDQNFGYDNSHMDNMQARILLKLEWSALEDAINQDGKQRITSIKDALVFRNYRREMFHGCDTMENKFELHEGLPEYTAFKLCTTNELDFKQGLNSKKDNYWQKESLVRSFGYYSGFIYAYLLDQTHNKWQYQLKSSDDLGQLVQNAYNIEMPIDVSAAFEIIKHNYSLTEISDFEQKLKLEKDSILGKYRQIFLNDTVLILDLTKPNVGFNPNTLQPFDTLGTIYPYIIITDNWGRLEVNDGGCLLSKDWSKATVPAVNIKKDGTTIKSNNWTLTLEAGWDLIKKDEKYFLLKQIE
jgi:hypothetical protein